MAPPQGRVEEEAAASLGRAGPGRGPSRRNVARDHAVGHGHWGPRASGRLDLARDRPQGVVPNLAAGCLRKQSCIAVTRHGIFPDPRQRAN